MNSSAITPSKKLPRHYVQAKITRLIRLIRGKGKREGRTVTMDKCFVELIRLGMGAKVPIEELKRQFANQNLPLPLARKIIRVLKHPQIAENLWASDPSNSISWQGALQQIAQLQEAAVLPVVPKSTMITEENQAALKSELRGLCKKLLAVQAELAKPVEPAEPSMQDPPKSWELDNLLYLLRFTPKAANSAARELTWDPPVSAPSSQDEEHGVWIEPGQEVSEQLARLAAFGGFDRAKAAAKLMQLKLPAVEMVLPLQSLETATS